jgi:perosamine synthetase
MCGENTADVTCYSFYANKTITTGEGGMAVTNNEILSERMRLMSLHGLSRDAWQRYSDSGSWDYRIVAPGFKYNLTDIAAAIGIHQLAASYELRQRREEIAEKYIDELKEIDEVDLPPTDPDRFHSWHLFPIRLRLGKLSITRNEFIDELKKNGVGCSVHWRPLHLHPYYADRHNWPAELFPNAGQLWDRIISLPLFPSMSAEEIEHVVSVVRNLCRVHTRASLSLVA